VGRAEQRLGVGLGEEHEGVGLSEPGAIEPPPVPLWPVWRFDSGYAELARYVTPRAVTLDFDFRAPLTEVEEAPGCGAESDRIRAKRLYTQLAAREVIYEDDPWASKEGVQQIRHLWWLLNGRLGNCLDIALAYTGICLAARVGALLALTEEHAFVVLTPGRLHLDEARAEPYELEGFAPARVGSSEVLDPGVRVGTGAALETAVAEGLVLAVDAVGVTTEGFDFKTAVERRAWWVGEDERPEGTTWLVDVPHLQTEDRFAELPHPTAFRPSIRQRVPAGGEFRDFAAHAEVVSALREADGMHVLIGKRGRGKSTIARHLAENAEDGAAWFLDASDRKALSNSLAQAMYAEEPRSENEVLDPSERKAMWETAFAYLRDKKDPWLIVLDNADGDPATLRGLIPVPRKGQRLLVTTINPTWRAVPGYAIHELSQVTSGDLGRFGHGRVAELIEGRPLLLDAFERLAENSGWDGHGLPEPDADLPAELCGPATFWSLLQEGEDFQESELKVAGFAAYLPANGQPVAVLKGLVPGSAQAIDLLVKRGLLAYDGNAEEVRMHWLFGEAIRLDLEEHRPELCDELVLALADDDDALIALDRRGDPDTVSRLDRRLAAIDDGKSPDFELGVALRRVAELLELHGSTRLSGKTYARAERHLQGKPLLLADCLQGRARTVNQHHTDDQVMLEDAIDWAKQAHAMLLSEAGATEAAAARCYAMQGLLMKALAKFSVEGKTKSELLHDSLTVLEEADTQRQESEEIGEPEKLRSTFNLAGIKIPLAQQEPELAEKYLNEAHDTYKQVGEARRTMYGRMNHPHIAACENGLGLVGYYRALLLPETREKQTEWLRDATEHVAQALKEREILDGFVDFEEAPKSAALLAKIALARNASPVAALGDTEGLMNQAKGELTRAGRALRHVSLPPNGSGLIEAIDDWARSDALRELVEEFGEASPRDDLAQLLEWLEGFSVRWNFRQEKGERNDIDPPQLSLLTEKVIKAAAKALGLVEGGSWREGRYDQVLILSGKARACLSRPLFAAQLIAKGKFEVGSVTALGAFRELDEEEIGLVEQVEGRPLADEYEAMDAGIRRAFDLGDPSLGEGEDSDLLGGSWQVREYEAASLPVNVIAAPSSEPEDRRANTPDTLAWFGTEFAKLERGERILMITTDIYLPYQHADALRMLALPYGVDVDAVGMVPGKVDRRLAYNFEPHNYLQETRSTIRSLRRLHAALTAVDQTAART
jgi:hypothetical protein